MRLALVMAVLAIMFGVSSVAQAQETRSCMRLCNACKDTECSDFCSDRECRNQTGACYRRLSRLTQHCGNVCKECIGIRRSQVYR